MNRALRVLVLDVLERPDPVRGARGTQVHRCSDAADLLGRALAGAADIAVVAPQAAGLDATVVARIRSAGCRVVGLASSPQDHELAGRIGLTDVVAAPVDTKLLQRLVASPASRDGATAGSRGGTVVAVCGAPGAPGRTTVAALLAVGAHRAGRRTTVLDADTMAPCWSLVAGATGGLSAALRRVALGEFAVDDLLRSPAPRLSVMAGASDPRRWVDADPSLVPRLLHALTGVSDVVVIDLPADIRPPHPAYDIGWAHDSAAFARGILAGSDVVVPVLSADPLGVHRFASWWPMLAEQADPEVVVANRYGSPRSGRQPGSQLVQVMAALGAPTARVDVGWNPKAADGLFSGEWHRAKGWGDAPERLWQAVAGQGARLLEIRDSGSLAS